MHPLNPPSDLTPCWVSLADGEEGEEGWRGGGCPICVFMCVCVSCVIDVSVMLQYSLM